MSTETRSPQQNRHENLLKLLKRFGCTADDYAHDVEEDVRPYLTGSREIDRWCCVTVNYSSCAHAKWFFLPCFGTAEEAQIRSIEFADDDIFEEIPVAVVDLDTWTFSVPDWRSLQFGVASEARSVS
jgi:hypothetical protein